MPCPLADTLDALPENAALAVGAFDGLHLGHQALLNAMQAFATATGRPACILTFGQLPLTLLDPTHAPGRIYDDAHLLTLLATRTPAPTLLIHQPFTPAFAALSPEAFARKLRGATLFCGEDWRFGAGAQGTPDFLAARGFAIHRIPYARWQNQRISSTRIRAALAQGDLPAVAAMLGRPWAFTGTIIHGRGLAGPTLGTPTLNIPYIGRNGEHLAPLARGVYRATAHIGPHQWRACLNFGTAPTLKNEPSPLLEAHLLGANGNFYNQTVTLTLAHARLRPERHFPTLGDLQKQIAADLAAIQAEP